MITFYSKEAGAGSNHGWQLSTTSLSSVSYLAVHAYEVIGNRNSFQPIHLARANLQAHTFLHLPSTQFLCKTQENPAATSSDTFSLSDKDRRSFRELVSCKVALAAVVKELNASMREGGRRSTNSHIRRRKLRKHSPTPVYLLLGISELPCDRLLHFSDLYRPVGFSGDF